MQIFLGLGSNLGDRSGALVDAKDALMKEGVWTVLQSTVLETKALPGADGSDLGQPDYLNQVLECETELGPQELLLASKKIEEEMGRPLAEKGSGKSRVIDVDILFYGSEKIVMPGLTIPHPRAIERDFVMAGMKELAPDFLHPVVLKAMKEL